MPVLTVQEAKEYRLPFGKHKAAMLEKVAESDDGMSYLRWLNEQAWLKGRAKDAIYLFLHQYDAQPTTGEDNDDTEWEEEVIL